MMMMATHVVLLLLFRCVGVIVAYVSKYIDGFMYRDMNVNFQWQRTE